MAREPVPTEAEEDAPETRLRLVLLAVALILVAGYALSIASVGERVLDVAGWLIDPAGHQDAAERHIGRPSTPESPADSPPPA
jgi:hypothetical protein